MTLSGNYDRKVATMKNSALNWIDDEGYCGYPTARVSGFAIVVCCDDDDSLAMADRARIYELADEFGVHPSIVCSLYDVMRNELYGGIVTALEDMADDPDYEELFDE